MESTSKSCKNGSTQNLNDNFVHLHFHTSYSFLDGYNPIKKAVKRLKELGMTACAITDHNHMGGIPEWKEACEENGIKPLLGVELYYTEDMYTLSQPKYGRTLYTYIKAVEDEDINEGLELVVNGFNYRKFIDGLDKAVSGEIDAEKFISEYSYLENYVDKFDTRQYHILFIAKNQTGWKNLVKIQSEAARLCTFNGRFLCDMNLLRKYSEGVICTTACIGSRPAHYINDNRNYEAAEKYITDMRDIFGDNFYLEIQPLNIDKQIEVNLFYMKMAKKHNIKCVATNDVHYTFKEDHDDHDTLLCIGTGQYKTEDIAREIWAKSKNKTKEFTYKRMTYSNDFWIKSKEEMIESFKNQSVNIPEELLTEYIEFYVSALNETNLVADSIEDIKLGSPTPLFSEVKVPDGYTPETYLSYLAYKGMYKYLSKHKNYDIKKYERRLHEELDVINPKGFAPYILAVWEYVNWCEENNIAVGPGRGSAAGSLALFSLNITKNIDPIKYDLLFSRFLTADRVSPPDVDLDFSWEKRDLVIKHLEEYYGSSKVAHIGTYTTLGVKNGLKDVGRVFGMDFVLMNNITKAIDEINDKPGAQFKDFDSMKNGDEGEQKLYEKFKELEERFPELFRLARAFEGTPRNVGIHASGILVTPCDVNDLFPLRYIDGVAITLFTGPQLEQFNSIKYDILGLKTLDIITKTIDNVSEISSINDLYDKVDVNDHKMFEMIRAKNTDAVFQIESNMMKGIVETIKPDCFDDMIAIVAIGRPGPVSIGLNTKYGNVKSGKEKIEYPIKGCNDILDKTYGNPVYQEQLMQISKRIANFDDTQADSITRKILGKKKREMFPMMKRCHIYGKKNIEGPAGWENDDKAPWYDPKGKYGGEIQGALINGYTEAEILNYFDKIEGFANYCFNQSHAACYAYLSVLTAWLKYYYPTQFMAAVLSMTADEKIPEYINICEKKMNIRVLPPDINISGNDFTPDGNRILYGLTAVKSVGTASIPVILAGAPYESLEDTLKRIPKKAFNKRVAENLIKAGAFDFIDTNRNKLLNELHKLRKDKKEKILEEDAYDKKIAMKYEEEALGTHISFHTWWEDLETNKKITLYGAKIKNITERTDKNGRLMGMGQLEYDGVNFKIIIFASKYANVVGLFDKRFFSRITVNGKKDERGTFIINDALPYISEENRRKA